MSDNPFGDPNDVNPFAEPSAATHSKRQASLDDYNPFEEQAKTPPPAINPTQSYTATPATIEPTRTEPPSTYNSQPFPSGFGGGQDEATRKRQEELEEKAAELDRKEQELQTRQQQVDRKNNFPPLPKCCHVQPCFYHDITLDIPIESQQTCKMLFYVWQLYAFALFFNFLTALALLCVDGKNGAITFGVSALYLVLFAPCSFLIWYRPVYKALRSDSSFSYMIFFFMFFFQIIFDVIYALGIPSFGTCGFINGAQEADGGSVAVAVMMFVCAAMWTMLAIFNTLLLRKVHFAYRRSGASLEKAQGEFARGVATNKNVQNTAAETVKAGISGGASSGTNY